jgi:hypothetical protein
MKKTYHGSCHCGAVRFEADIDLDAGTNKCNCTICTKMRNWNALIKPSAFRLLAGEDSLTDYQHGPKIGHYPFCGRCGIHCFSRGDIPEVGGAYVTVQLATLDDVSAADLAAAPVRYTDGRNNDWDSTPRETRHL